MTARVRRMLPPRSLLAFVSTMLLTAPPVAAQVLRGTVVDRRSKPVDSASVTVSAAGGESVGGASTSNGGEFSVQLPAAGSYVVRASKAGYQPTMTRPITVGVGLDASIRLRLQPSKTPADTLAVAAESVAVEEEIPYLAQVGFYAREHRGIGRFLTRAELDKVRSDRLTDALRGMPGVQIVCSGAYCDVQAPGAATMFTRGVCQQTVVLDGVVLRSGGISSGGEPVDQLLNPFNLAGVEVYSSPSGVPVQFKGYMSPCGAIIAWSRR